jgi:Ca-activated chloride channel family protein
MRAVPVAAGLLLLPALLAAQPTPTFTTSVEAVYVDVFVTRDGGPVPGLAAADFEVRDNGVRQEVTLASLEEVPIVAVLAFDVSGSVVGERLEDLRAGGRALLAGLRPQDQAALIVFSQELRIVVPQTGDRSALERGLDELHAEGNTGLWDGLYTGLMLPVSRGRSMVVLFTDGRDNVSWLTQEQVQRVADESDVLVYVVAIVSRPEQAPATSALDVPPSSLTLQSLPFRLQASNGVTLTLTSLRLLAESTGGRLLPAGSSAQLKRTFPQIQAEMRSRYLLSYGPKGVVREGWHRLEVKVKGHRGAVRSRVGYFVAPQAEVGRQREFDRRAGQTPLSDTASDRH